MSERTQLPLPAWSNENIERLRGLPLLKLDHDVRPLCEMCKLQSSSATVVVGDDCRYRVCGKCAGGVYTVTTHD